MVEQIVYAGGGAVAIATVNTPMHRASSPHTPELDIERIQAAP